MENHGELSEIKTLFVVEDSDNFNNINLQLTNCVFLALII